MHSYHFQSWPAPQTVYISFSSKPWQKPALPCLFGTSPLKQKVQHQLELVMLGRRVWVKNMKNKERGEITVWCVVCYA